MQWRKPLLANAAGRLASIRRVKSQLQFAIVLGAYSAYINWSEGLFDTLNLVLFAVLDVQAGMF